MRLPRAAGVLLHPTSLPGPQGCGDLGDSALRFLDWAAESGFTLWQMLPLGPTGYGNSPYQCYSAFAGNPLLIASTPASGHAAVDGPAVMSVAHISAPTANVPPQEGSAATTAPTQQPSPSAPLRADFARAWQDRGSRLQRLVGSFTPDDAFDAFVAAEAHWLPDFTLFMALKERFDGLPWTSWAPRIAQREPDVLERWRRELEQEIMGHTIQQFEFFRQLAALKKAAARRGIRLMGDIPIYVAHDSADVWAHPELFDLLPDGRLRTQAGVPPDYFSPTGQLWGNPLYRWEEHRSTGYAWWIDRLRSAFRMFDVVRLDHFRAFADYWAIDGAAATAAVGVWRPGPGRALFDAVRAALGDVPLVAEDLGDISPAVTALLQSLKLPGMTVLQFAFGDDTPEHPFLPHNYRRHSVVYTGTHDNDTTCGWWASLGAAGGPTGLDAALPHPDRVRVDAYVGRTTEPMPWPLIRLALGSVADTAIVPMQDLLALGSDRRMNTPGATEGNWTFRFNWGEVPPDLSRRLRRMLHTFGRLPTR